MAEIRLGSLVEVVRRTLAPEQLDDNDAIILLEHIAKETGEVVPGLAGQTETKSSKAAFEPGDVLYGKLRPALRKCCVAEVRGAASMDIAVLRPVIPDSAHYLAAVLRSESFTRRVVRLVAGASLPRVNVKELLALNVPWPDEPAELARLNSAARSVGLLRRDIGEMLEEVTRLEKAVAAGLQ